MTAYAVFGALFVAGLAVLPTLLRRRRERKQLRAIIERGHRLGWWVESLHKKNRATPEKR